MSIGSHANNGGNVYVSTIQRNVERPKTGLIEADDKSQSRIHSGSESYTGGFNLLWLVSVRIHAQDRNRGRSPHRVFTQQIASRRKQGVHLHSNLPRRILRYQRPSKLVNSYRVSKRTKGKHVGFEMEFRIRSTSGNG